jgi:carbohydrate-selective porin OprB
LELVRAILSKGARRLRAGLACAMCAGLLGMGCVAAAQTEEQNVQQVLMLLRLDEYGQSLAKVDRMLKATPHDCRLLSLRGIALNGLQRPVDALGAFEAALQYCPDDLLALEGAARIEYARRQPDAEGLLQRILKLQPHTVTAHAMLASIYRAKGECAKALPHFEASSVLFAQRPGYQQAYAYCLTETKHWKQAAANYRAVLEANPNAAARSELAQVEQKLNDAKTGRKPGGVKSRLQAHGVGLSGWLQLDGSTVATGGQPKALGFDGQDLLDVAVNVDAGKLLGVPGGTFLIDVQSHNGPNVLTHQMPALQDADNMDAYQETSVDRAWYQQDLFGKKVQAQVGLMYVDDQFFTVPYGQNFVSLDFSSDASISTFVLPTFPKGSFGGDLVVSPKEGLSFSGGMYNDHSTELSYDPGGDLFLTEEGWQSKWHHLPYKLQVGAWRDTGRFQRFAGGVSHHVAGIYAVASRKLWQPGNSEDRGVGMFFQFGAGPESVAAVRRHYGAGVVWTGPFASRPKDELGVAFSDSLLTRKSNFVHGFENEFEVYYQIAAWKGLTVQPDVEYWMHPGGMTTPDTTLVLTRVMYTF